MSTTSNGRDLKNCLNHHVWSVSHIFFCKYVRKYNNEEKDIYIYIIEINLCTRKDMNDKDCTAKNSDS